MTYLYNLFFYQPLLNGLVFFYNTAAFQDLGVAIILLTILIRIILFPLFQKGARQQVLMQEIQPKLKKIKEQHRNDKEKQVRATLDLYKSYRLNPFSGFLLILVQIPVLIALYQIFLKSFSPELFVGQLYSFIAAPEHVNTMLLGLISLEGRSIVLVGLAAVAQYFQGKLSIVKPREARELTPAERMSRSMVLIGPILTVVFFINLPAAVGLYWFTTSVFSIFQQIIINKQLVHGNPGNISKKNT